MARPSGSMAALAPALPLALFFLGAYVLPVAILVVASFYTGLRHGEPTIANYLGFLTDWFHLSILLDTIWLGVQVTIVTLVIAYPLGLVYMRAGQRLRAVILLLILLPLLTNTVVRTFAWIAILGRDGVVNATLIALGLTDERLRMLYTRPWLVVALAQIFLPLMALPLNNSLDRIDANLVKASEGLGASAFFTFRRVLLPLSAPGAIGGALLVFAGACTAFITQTLVGGGRQIFMPLLIYQQAIGVQRWTFAAALSVIFALAVMLLVYAVNQAFRARLRGVHG
jgi:putative spermidine/putrescine transport system permease protein